MKKLWKAIDDKLVADVSLVALTGYTTTNCTIARADAPDKDKSKGVYFKDVFSETLKGANTNKIKMTDVDFMLVGSSLLECSDIRDRLEALFENADIKKAFLDFSNSEVYCMFSKILDMEGIEYNEKTNVWETTVSVEITWSYK